MPDILTAQERRERNREEMKADILHLAREQMRAEGAAALNLNQIARDLGMKTPSLYSYFAGKMAIYDALFRLGFELYGAQMADERLWEGSLEEQVRKAFERYFTFAIENPDLFQIMFQRPVPGFEPSEESMAVSWAQLARARARLASALESSSIQISLPLEKASDLLISMLHGITALHLANEPHLSLGEGRFGSLIPEAVALFSNAWRTAGSEPPSHEERTS